MKVIVVVDVDAKDEEGNEVNNGSIRTHIEGFEDRKFENVSHFANTAHICMDDLCYYDMSEFMERYNNDEVDMANTFMTYINVENTV